MAQMLIRNIPDHVLAAFKELARDRGLSQEEAARQLIVDAVEYRDRRVAMAREAREIRESLRAKGLKFGDSAELIRRMRDSR